MIMWCFLVQVTGQKEMNNKNSEFSLFWNHWVIVSSDKEGKKIK